MDRLSEILNRFSINAQVFFSGNMCGSEPFGARSDGVGHLHLLKSGTLTLKRDNADVVVFREPTVIFFPHATRHRIDAKESDKAELVCSSIHYADGVNNPLASALPQSIHYALSESAMLNQVAQWLFDEAFADRCGRGPMINRLLDIFLIHILRDVLDNGRVEHGMLAGLSHPQLAKVLTAIHKEPQNNWSLESMADISAMSRSKFAELFRSTVGQSPGEYVADWRISMAQALLMENRPVGLVANAVGYENGSALARVFRKKTGLSPREWVTQTKKPN